MAKSAIVEKNNCSLNHQKSPSFIQIYSSKILQNIV